MTTLTVIPDMDGHWEDLNDIAPEALFGQVEQIARISKGMKSGKSSVVIRGVTESGQIVVLEVALSQLDTAVQVFNLVDAQEEPEE